MSTITLCYQQSRVIAYFKMTTQIHRKRQHQDLHFLNEDGMVACNPRDREAAHRAEVEGIATEDSQAVTCKKCLDIIRKLKREKKSIS